MFGFSRSFITPNCQTQRELREIKDGHCLYFGSPKQFDAEGDEDDEEDWGKMEADDEFSSARRSNLARHGLIVVDRPEQGEPGVWMIMFVLTEHGEKVIDALDEGLVWKLGDDGGPGDIDLVATESWVRRLMPQFGSLISDYCLKQIEKIKHPDLQHLVAEAIMCKLAC